MSNHKKLWKKKASGQIHNWDGIKNVIWIMHWSRQKIHIGHLKPALKSYPVKKNYISHSHLSWVTTVDTIESRLKAKSKGAQIYWVKIYIYQKNLYIHGCMNTCIYVKLFNLKQHTWAHGWMHTGISNKNKIENI